MQGTVKRLVKDKGFGFIVADDSGDELFFHRSSVIGGTKFDQTAEGDRVTFEIGESPKGPRAEEVRVAARAT